MERKPEIGRYKCNINASFSLHRNRVRIGLCIRDGEGSFVLAGTLWQTPICSADRGEAPGLLKATLKKCLIIFTRAKTMSLSLAMLWLNVNGYSLCILKTLMLSLIKRQTNEIAHAPARVATC
jgi:hypothetical protein